ncbi:probable RNA-directed DNA polymerase from transposon BS [Trichonephila clavipes]|uniref:Probable RNA-directed DNA polymerase from transposon BS n=1 Tax=Trichonephila clavipes TaxID=2585209 RepID=A0A8X6UYB5_TRICX|nr:probable RNA-directed DNA polymerase from transposon BS [Trichonephila clavipes]
MNFFYSKDNLVALHFKYDQARHRFVEGAQNEIAVVPDFHKRILFSDEAHFWLNGYANKQNCRIWSEANPQVYVETPLHPEKLTVWCALWAGGIIGPYFFKNDEGHNVTVNGDRYRAMITNFFIPELNNHDVQELWFQQDGATCHTDRATIDLLKDTFGDRLISRFGPVNWPPRSCDLTPLDYFLWGYVKSLVYADKPQTLDHLKDNIRRVIADIRPQMLEKVIENWTSRLDYIRASRGSPMPEIIFKNIFDFLKDREIRVRFRDSLSKTFRLSQGVPQGSVLSPLPFSLYIAGIEKIISRRCEVGLFADDIVLWNSNSDVVHIETAINTTLSDIQIFAEQHKLIFNVSKSTSSFFTTNRRLYNYQPQIFMESKSLLYEKHPKYLGYILDPEILSNKHIDYVINKGRKRLDLLKYIAGRDWGADAGTLRLTYASLIRPVLEYGSQIYFSASRTNLAKLDRVQSSAARIITGMRHSCPTDLVLFEADIMPLDLRRKLLLSKSELIAIDEALRIIKTMTSPDEIWILCDSRSAIQHLSDWTNVGDKNIGLNS